MEKQEVIEELRRLRKSTKGRDKSLQKKLEKQNRELSSASEWERIKQVADSIKAEPEKYPKGVKEVSVKNLYTQEDDKIKLNPAFSPHQNAELLYKKSSKGKRGYQKCVQKVQDTKKEIEENAALLNEIDGVLSMDKDSEEFRVKAEEMIERLSRDESNKKTRETKESRDKYPYRHYVFKGWDIFVGKNNSQNDELTVRFSNPSDIWLHVTPHAGSHVLIRRSKNHEWPPESVLLRAGSAAAWFSKAKHAAKAEVHVTEARYVRKRRKSPPGEVIAERCRCITVVPKPPEELFGLNKG